MGDHAEDARDEEEWWDMLRTYHREGRCGVIEECPFCDPDFEPLFEHQRRE